MAEREPEGLHRQMEERARAAEARLAAVLDSVQDGVWVLDLNGRTLMANHRLGQLLGVSPQELGRGTLQREVLERLRSSFTAPREAFERWQQLKDNPEQVCWDEVELRRPHRRILERHARPIHDPGGRVPGRLEVYRDITPERLLEDKVLQREKLAAVGQLVSGIAHELNNPLTAVTGYAQLLASAELPAELREKTVRLRQEAERAGRIVSNLLLFARGGKAEKQLVRVGDVLERSLSLRAYELKVENIEVIRELPADLPPVLADPHQLEQVFLNILLNAEQAILSARNRGRITLRAGAERGRVRLRFSNDGPGIAPDLLPHIFDPFVTTKPAAEGTGLGLYISRTIVREHGGDILAESGAGGGATFVVELPAQARQSAAPPARATAHRREATGRRRAPKGRRVLVVDDEPSVAYLIADALEQEGYEVRVHTESQRALSQALAEVFDLAVLDVRMPGLDGQAFYRILRHEGSALADRLLFTTGDTLTRETAAFLEQARLPFLPKPFHVEELQDRVRASLDEIEPARAEPGGDDD